MIDLLLVFILLIGIFTGLKRGLILQFFHLIGFVIAFAVAVMYYDELSPRLTLWVPYPELPEGSTWAVFMDSLPLEQAFYNAVSFAVLFFGAKIILHIIASMLDFVAELPILNSMNTVLGGALGLIETYVILFVILYIMALVPLSIIQNLLDGSLIAQLMIEHTPVFSEKLKTLWIERVAG